MTHGSATPPNSSPDNSVTFPNSRKKVQLRYHIEKCYAEVMSQPSGVVCGSGRIGLLGRSLSDFLHGGWSGKGEGIALDNTGGESFPPLEDSSEDLFDYTMKVTVV